MGGLGSGNRWQSSSKRAVESCHYIDVGYLAREGLLRPGMFFTLRWSRRGKQTGSISGQSQSDAIILKYSVGSDDGSKQQFEYSVPLAKTPCHFGGERTWLRCPVAGCGKRVATLYGGKVFSCRECQHLVYSSQNETDSDREARRAQKIADRLGWSGGVLMGSDCERPKGMHQKTYRRLISEQNFHAQRSINAIIESVSRYSDKYGIQGNRLGGLEGGVIDALLI